ncbi:MAG: thioredoxin domain-containing protein, partial [Deltaproteobacteria bacterium]|nr:thioredoxin domain-containing protein [Deltaproteobacteria bacterium]
MDSKDHKFTNRLIHESSPYLLQHARNPVNWYPWRKEALDKARKENKLIIVSIGYAACHWCHVMEEESFEDEKVAKFMNDNFVAIKVDREERPDIDQVYMNAVQLVTGRGGWPLNCIALPDGRPIYGGTYFPKEQWLDMLAKVVNFVKQNPDKAEQQAKALTEGVQSSEMIQVNTEKAEFTMEDLNRIFADWKKDMDPINGGSKGAPKFPFPVAYQFLLHYHHLTGNGEALKAITTTLDKMADGGIYDQIGGGFSRYSTDAHWRVPHFEKMLYDNAQLVSL